MRNSGEYFLAVVLLVYGLGCGGGKSAVEIPPPTTIVVSVSPVSSSLLVKAPAKITATVSGTPNTEVSFLVVEFGGGQVTAAGDYVAPSAPGIYHVRATSVAAPTRYADATLTVRDYANGVTRMANASDAHDYHTASLLSDGSVIVVGGVGFTGVHANAERFIPSLGRFQTSAALSQARIQHAAVVLQSGKVLVSGGYNPLLGGTPFNPAFKSTEIYDRATDQFTTAPDMNFPRRAHMMTLLKDGRVLVTGGIQLIGSGFGATPNVEIYDANANSFATTGRMNEGRWMHTATLLNDGRVLVVGGRSNNCTDSCSIFSLATAELYDPATGSFTPTGSLHMSRYSHTAALLTDGRVLILGGETTDQPSSDQVATGEVYDPATGSFQVFGSLLGGRSHHTMTLLNNGKYLIAGGRNWNGTVVGTTEIYDATTGASVLGPEMNDWRIRHTATRLLSGEVLIVGGNNSGSSVVPVDLFQ